MKEVKMWLDDVRPAPEGWIWIKTVKGAQFWIEQMTNSKNHEITHMSLDHDLGAEEREIECGECYGAGISSLTEDFCAPCNGTGKILDVEATLNARGDSPEGSGYDLVKWMCEGSYFPTKSCIVHSWNPAGAKKMVADIQKFCPDIHCIYKPYEVFK